MQMTFQRLALLAMVAIPAYVPPATANDAIDVDSANPYRLILHFCQIDGAPIRPLISDTTLRHQLDRQGTPQVSANGKYVTFDAWTSSKDFTWQESRIIVADIDGGNAKDISDGVMPSFSPDGLKLVVSRPPKYAQKDGATGMSIWTMDADGQNQKMLADQGAWGGRWSPDGRTIVFHGGVDENGNDVRKSCLRLYDVATGSIVNAFSPTESPFSQLSFHFEWSKGSERLVVFGGPLASGAGSASAIINVDKGISSLVILGPPEAGRRVFHGATYDWHPDGNSVLMAGVVGGRRFPVSISTTDAISDLKFNGIPDNVVVGDLCYTPDGKNLIVSFGYYERN